MLLLFCDILQQRWFEALVKEIGEKILIQI